MRIDRRLAFLERAAARLTLYHEGVMDLEQAIAGLESALCEMCNCACYWEIYDALGRGPRKRRAT